MNTGLKHEPNDTGGPDLDTKIAELKLAIFNAERERVKAEARLNRLREGGVAVDEYIDQFVYTYEPENDNIQEQRHVRYTLYSRHRLMSQPLLGL